MVKVTCLLAKAGSGVGLSFGVRALTEMEIRWDVERVQFTSALSHNYLSAVSIGTQQFLLATSEIL